MASRSPREGVSEASWAGGATATNRLVLLLPGMTLEEAVRHIAKVDEEVTYSVDVRPQEARDLLARLKKSDRFRTGRWNASRR